jgi:hypothetical protein
MASGLLAVAAAAERWWPVCRPGSFDTGGCLTIQEDPYDFMVPTEPWTPVGSSAELYGAGLVLLAAACIVVPGLLAGTAFGRRLAVASWITALGVAVVGAATWLSGVRDEVVTGPWLEVASSLWVLGVPALVTAALISHTVAYGVGTSPRFGSRTMVGAALLLANPIVALLFAPAFLNYASYDTTPWTEAVGGWALVVAGALLLPACRPVPAAAAVPIRRQPHPMV